MKASNGVEEKTKPTISTMFVMLNSAVLCKVNSIAPDYCAAMQVIDFKVDDDKAQVYNEK